MRRIIAATVFLCPTAALAESWQALTGAEIHTALSARVLAYDDGGSQNFFADGRTLYEAGAGQSWGKWWVEADQYCSSWPPNPSKSCYAVEAMGLSLRFVGASGAVTAGQYIDLN